MSEGHSVSRAVIRYQRTEQDYSQQVELGVQPDQTSMSFQLRGLRADSTYQLELWTLNNMGESVDRPHVILQTLTPQESKRESEIQPSYVSSSSASQKASTTGVRIWYSSESVYLCVKIFWKLTTVYHFGGPKASQDVTFCSKVQFWIHQK